MKKKLRLHLNFPTSDSAHFLAVKQQAWSFWWTGAQVFSISIVEAAVEGRSEKLKCEIPSQALDWLL